MGTMQTMMKSMILAACVAAMMTLGASASAHGYGSGYGGQGYGGYGGQGYGDYGNQGYGGYDGNYGYRRDYYADFYQRYLAFLRECRQHMAFHRELRELREETPYGYGDPYNLRDQRQAMRATHDLWHRDHPYATQCPSYGAYYNWARYRGYDANSYGWGGYRNDYWTR